MECCCHRVCSAFSICFMSNRMPFSSKEKKCCSFLFTTQNSVGYYQLHL